MGKLPQDLPRDYATLSPEARADVVRKLRRYVERGAWAQAQLQQIGVAARDEVAGDGAGLNDNDNDKGNATATRSPPADTER